MLSGVFSRWIIRKNALSRFSHKCVKPDRRRTKKFVPLIRTDIIVQEGPEIHEAELMVQKIRKIDDIISGNDKVVSARLDNGKICEYSKSLKNESSKEILIETEEGTAILFGKDIEVHGDKRNNSPKIRKSALIENMITDEINCRVAIEALKEIMKLEDDDYSCKNGRNFNDETSQTNGRERVFNQLIDMIVKTRDNDMLIEALTIIRGDRLSQPKNIHKDRLCDEALIRSSQGHLQIPQLIELIKTLSSYEDPSYGQVLDDLWFALKIGQFEMDEKNMASLFRILPLFRKNRRIVKSILDKRLSINWWRLSGTSMSEILDLGFENGESKNIAVCAKKWIKMNVCTAEESELFDFMNSLVKMKFSDERSVEKSLERFMRDRGITTKDPALIAVIMNYCGKNRIKNRRIFEICSNYLTNNSMNLPASLLAPIFVPFGYLNCSLSVEFFENFERALENKFFQLETNDALDILLSLIYLKRAPVNLVDELFTRKFIDKLHSKRDAMTIIRLREKLRFIDAAMEIECDRYERRMIPEVQCEKTVLTRARIKRIIDLIYGELSKIVGGDDRLSKFVILGRLKDINLYTLDILVHSTSMNSSIFSLRNVSEKGKTAVLIHLPEHYCRNTTFLTGPQEMRMRHIRKLGFRVMTLNYKILLTLRLCPSKMNDYLTERLRSSADF